MRLNLSWISFVRCVKEIFLVLIQHSPETRPKRNFKCWFKQKKKFKARDDFFTQKHTHHVFVVRLHTHLNTRAEREREREREATMMLMTAPTTTTTTSAPSDDVPPLLLRCF